MKKSSVYTHTNSVTRFDTFLAAYQHALTFDGPWAVVVDGTVKDKFNPGRTLPYHRILADCDETYKAG